MRDLLHLATQGSSKTSDSRVLVEDVDSSRLVRASESSGLHAEAVEATRLIVEIRHLR